MHKPRRVRGKRVPFVRSILTAPPEITDFLTNIRLVTHSYANHISYLRITASLLVHPLASLLSIGFALNNRFRIAQQISLLPPGNQAQKRVQTRSPSITNMYPSVANSIPLQLVKTQLSSLKVLNQVYEHKLNKSTLKEQGNKSTALLQPNILTIQSLSASVHVDELSNNTILNEMIRPLEKAIKHSFSVGHAPSIALKGFFGSKPGADRGNSYSNWYFRSVGLGFERHFPDLFPRKQFPTNNLQTVRSLFIEFLAQATALRVVTNTPLSTTLLTILEGLNNTGFQTPSAQTVETIIRKLKGNHEQSAIIQAFSSFSNLDRILPVKNIFPKKIDRIISKESFSSLAEPNKFGWNNFEQSSFLSSPAVEQTYSQIKPPSILSRKLNNSLLKSANNSLSLTTFLNFEVEMQVTRAIQFVNDSSQRTLSDANLTVLRLLPGIPGQAKYLPVKSKNSHSGFYGDLLLGYFNQIDSLVGQLNFKLPLLNFYRKSSQLGAIPVTNRLVSKHWLLATVGKTLTNYSHISAPPQIKWAGMENLPLQNLVHNEGFSPSRIISHHTSTYNFSYLPFKSVYRFPHQNFTSVISDSLLYIKKLIASLDLPTLREFKIASHTSANAQIMTTIHLASRHITTQKGFRDNKSSFNDINNFNINSDQTMIEPVPGESSKLRQPNIIEMGNVIKNPSLPNNAQREVQQRYEQDSEIRSFQAQIERIFSEELIKFDALHDNGLPTLEFSRLPIDGSFSEMSVSDGQYDDEIEIKPLKRKIEQLLEEELRRYGYIPW